MTNPESLPLFPLKDAWPITGQHDARRAMLCLSDLPPPPATQADSPAIRAKDYTTGDLVPDRIAIIAEVIHREGGGPGNSIHSWRCEYPERYGKCDCVDELARSIVEALDEAALGLDCLQR